MEIDAERAVELFQIVIASQDGSLVPRAQCSLGTCYATGHGVTVDMIRATELWVAAANGPDGAQFNLAKHLLRIEMERMCVLGCVCSHHGDQLLLHVSAMLRAAAAKSMHRRHSLLPRVVYYRGLFSPNKIV